MRPVNSAAQAYQPGDPPSNPADMPVFLRQELAKLKVAIDTVSDGFLPVVYAYPPKPRAGMLRNFDGVTIDPGSGGGLYRYDGSTWVFVG